MRRTQFFRRCVQAVCLVTFCLLLCQAGKGGLWEGAARCFLSLDPVTGLAIPLAMRECVTSLWPVVLVYVSAALLGRIFCGWVCPMGTSLDALGSLARTGRQGKQKVRMLPRVVKYSLLGAILLAALFGINMAFWASPLPLTARLYALVLYPMTLSGMENLLSLGMPLAERWGMEALRYWQPEVHTFSTAGFVAVFWCACLVLERITPRFWCRYLCPAGALLGLLAYFAPWRRRVDVHACVACGRCSTSCPTGICQAMPGESSVAECIVCQNCVQLCPHEAVRFGRRGAPATNKPPLPSRRAFCTSLLAGTMLGGLASLSARGEGNPPVRPPGSVPEHTFLTLCLRCGACVQACPTGGLQPLWLESGFGAMFSPRLVPRLGPCRPECTACGHACPSKAILPLPLEEKHCAKIGTALIDRSICLAWAEKKRCMVCKENCPYGAIDVEVPQGQTIPVPQVRAERCYGCGYCERYCPTSLPAITVRPQGALRLTSQAYAATAKARGLQLYVGRGAAAQPPELSAVPSGETPPGFLEE